MKVVNPYHTSAVEQFAVDQAATVDNYLSTNAESEAITFDQIRADFPDAVDPKTGTAPMTDGTIAAILSHLGYAVSEE